MPACSAVHCLPTHSHPSCPRPPTTTPPRRSLGPAPQAVFLGPEADVSRCRSQATAAEGPSNIGYIWCLAQSARSTGNTAMYMMGNQLMTARRNVMIQRWARCTPCNPNTHCKHFETLNGHSHVATLFLTSPLASAVTLLSQGGIAWHLHM